tara:strand:+ start:423 stop:974 length:552 start_codon:yes stop_codon:yes gene_type:complete
MSITINGNGTVSGISVGGLPNGIVDTDTLANGAVTSAKKTAATGEVLQVVHNQVDTSAGGNNYTALLTSTSWTDVSGATLSITPKASGSTILLSANCRLGSSYASYITQMFKWVDNAGNDINTYTNEYIVTTNTGTGAIHLPLIASDVNVTGAHTYKLQYRQSGGYGIYIYTPIVCTATEIKA